MPIEPVTRRSLPDAVFEQLARGIVTGDLEPGEHLPSERALAEALQVSRPAVREALTRLAQSGLVDIRQGEPTRVRDFQRTAGLDLLPRLLVNEAGELDLAVARSVMEVRAAIGPEVAALAADRGGADLVEMLAGVVDDMAAALDDLPRLQRQAVAFWDLLVDGSDNVVYRLMFNALTRAYEPVMDAVAVLMRTEVSDVEGFRAVVSAVAARDPDRARAASRRILQPSTDAALETITELLNADDDRA